MKHFLKRVRSYLSLRPAFPLFRSLCLFRLCLFRLCLFRLCLFRLCLFRLCLFRLCLFRLCLFRLCLFQSFRRRLCLLIGVRCGWSYCCRYKMMCLFRYCL